MLTLVDPTRIPGADLHPDDVEAEARRISSVGNDVATQGTALVTAWRKLRHCYEAPEDETLFDLMSPVEGHSRTIAGDLEAVSTALLTFAADVRPIKTELAALRAEARTFVTTAASGITTKTPGVHGLAKTETVSWDVDQGSVTTNNMLIARVNDQVELLWAAERRCANAIFDRTGHAQLRAGDTPGATKSTSYGLATIPVGSPTDWGAEGAKTRTRTDAMNAALGHFIADPILDAAGLVGFDLTSRNADDWNWSLHNAVRARAETADGMVQLGATALAFSGAGLIAASTGTRLGAAARVQQRAAVTAGKFAVRQAKADPWGAGTTAVLTVGTLFIPGVGEAKVAELLGKGARTAGRAFETTSDAARAARTALKESRAAGLSKHALESGLRTLEMSPQDMHAALKQLQQSLGAPAHALAVDGAKDLTLLMERDKHARARMILIGHPEFARSREVHDSTATFGPETPEEIAERDGEVGHLLHDREQAGSTPTGLVTRAPNLEPKEIHESEIEASKVWTTLGRDVHMVKPVQGKKGEGTADLIVEGIGRVEIYSPRTRSSDRVVSEAFHKATQCNFLHIALGSGQLDSIEIEHIPARIFGSKKSGRNISAVLITLDGEPVLYDSRRS